MARAIWLVLDSLGIGHAPDAAAYGDAGADTFGHIAAACAAASRGPLQLPNLTRLVAGPRLSVLSTSAFLHLPSSRVHI